MYICTYSYLKKFVQKNIFHVYVGCVNCEPPGWNFCLFGWSFVFSTITYVTYIFIHARGYKINGNYANILNIQLQNTIINSLNFCQQQCK